jgi:hypothetical protein
MPLDDPSGINLQPRSLPDYLGVESAAAVYLGEIE